MDKITEALSNIDLNSLITIFDIQIALAIVVCAFLFKGMIARFVLRITYFFLKIEKPNVKESKMYNTLKRMVMFTSIYVALRFIPLSKQIKYMAKEGFKVLIIIFITRCITSIMTKDSKLFKKMLNLSEDGTVNDFFCKIFRGLTWIVSIFIIMTELGFDLSGLATGLGLVSAVIALAAQELVKNLLSGFSILTDKPFNIGDWIEVGEYAGRVMDISFRSTRIKALNNTLITIPNSKIASEFVINWNKLKSRRVEITLNLDMNTPIDKIKKTIKAMKVVLKNNSCVLEDTVHVYFDQIGSFSTDIKIFLYVNETEYLKYLNAKQEILCTLLAFIEKENIELAYPTQTVYLKNTEGESV